MSAPRNRPPYLHLVKRGSTETKLDLKLNQIQGVLFPTLSASSLIVLQLRKLDGKRFSDLLEEVQPALIVDLRLVPLFDVGLLTRKSAFALFKQQRIKYVDLLGSMGATDPRDSRLNPELLATQLQDALRSQEPRSGPTLLLVDAQQFEDDYINRLAKRLRSGEPRPLEIYKVPERQHQ